MKGNEDGMKGNEDEMKGNQEEVDIHKALRPPSRSQRYGVRWPGASDPASDHRLPAALLLQQTAAGSIRQSWDISWKESYGTYTF